MLGKVAGLARTLAILLAIVAAFVAIPANVPLVLVLLGVIGGFAYRAEDFMRMAILAMVLPVVGVALGVIPQAGGYLTAIMGNVALAVAGALATMIVIRLYEVVKGDITGLAK